MSNHKTVAQELYLGLVASLGCIVCRLRGFGYVKAQVHHLRDSAGGARKNGHMMTMPLCEPDHNGKHGIHGDRATIRNMGLEEIDLLSATLELTIPLLMKRDVSSF